MRRSTTRAQRGTAIVIAAGAAIGLADAQTTPDPQLGGSSYSCTINGWLWMGGFDQGDFLSDANWFNCGILGGPTTDLPVYFGPVEQSINGVPQGVTLPVSPAVLMADFASPGLRMVSASDITLSVVGATYTCTNGIIGDTLSGFQNNGAATLELDDAVWEGTITVGQSGGNGRLVFLNDAAVTGTITIGTGHATIENHGAFTVPTGINNNAQGEVSWINAPGAITTLDGNTNISRSWPTQPAGFDNQPGATLRKAGAGTSSIYWDYAGAGDISVTEGTLNLAAGFSGSHTATTSEGARLQISGATADDAALDIQGSIALNPAVQSERLELSGVYAIESAGQLGLEVINKGDALMQANPNNNSQEPAIWRNTPGATLEFFSNAGLGRSWPGTPADLVNEAGATIAKSGGSTSTIGWHTTNAGAIVTNGNLNLSGGYESQGGTIDVLEGTLDLGGTLRGDTDATVAQDALLAIGGTPDPAASFNITGPARLDALSGGGTLSLSGVYTIASSSATTAAEIINTGDATLESNPNNSSAGAALWRNTPGATLELISNAGFSRSWPASPADLINESGATLRKSGGSTSSIGWHTTNTGTIVCEDGTLRFAIGLDSSGHIEITGGTVDLDGQIAGTSTVSVHDGGLLAIGGTPAPEAAYEITGDSRLDAISGGGTLRLSGEFDIVASGNQTDATIVNEGDATLSSNPNNSSTGQATWRNTEGSTLTLVSNAGFSRSWPASPAMLINGSGATLRRTGGSTSTIGWDLVNEGTIDIVDGTLNITSNDPQLKAPTSVIAGAGRLDFTTAPALFNRGTLNPTPRDPAINPDGLTIDVPFIQNDETSVFRTQIGSLSGKLTCTGVYDVGGSIDLQRLGEFEPDGSKTFVVLEAQFISGVFGDYFDNAVPDTGSDTAHGVRTGDLSYDLTYTPTQIIVSNVSVVVPPCNPADIADPSGLLDLADINAFVNAFALGDELADIAEPFGLLDLADINTFVASFLAGCP